MVSYEKQIKDEAFKKFRGKYFGESWYKTIIDKDQDGYYKEGDTIKVLFKFRKNKIFTN